MSTQELTTRTAMPANLERLLLGGDLEALQPDQRIAYYKTVCETVGLNPLTKPFEFIKLNGKMVLYALKACTDQLRSVHHISIKITAREVTEGCYVVTAQARNPAGREDENIGAVPIASLKGEALCNAMMKAETKAKRRVTLSICGLGMLDETEVESIPSARVVPVDSDKYPVSREPVTIGKKRDANATTVQTADMKIETPKSSVKTATVDTSRPYTATQVLATPPPDIIAELQERNRADNGIPAEEDTDQATARAVNFARVFEDALPARRKKEAKALRHAWLAEHHYFNSKGEATAKAIPYADFFVARDSAAAWARLQK